MYVYEQSSNFLRTEGVVTVYRSPIMVGHFHVSSSFETLSSLISSRGASEDVHNMCNTVEPLYKGPSE